MDDRNQNLQCHPSSAVAVVEAEEADVVEEVSVVGCEEAAIGAVSAVDVVEASEVEVEGVGSAEEVSVVVNETAVMEVVVVADSGTSTPPCLPNSELKGHQPVVAVVVEESDSKVASTITDQVPTVMVEDLLMVQVGTVHHPEEDSEEEDLVGMVVVPPEEVMEEEAAEEEADSNVKDQACMMNETRSDPGIRQVRRFAGFGHGLLDTSDVECVSDQGGAVFFSYFFPIPISPSAPFLSSSRALTSLCFSLLSHLSVMRKYSWPYYVYLSRGNVQRQV